VAKKKETGLGKGTNALFELSGLKRSETAKPEVEEVSEAAEEAQPEEGRKLKRDRSWDAQRSRATYDLPPFVIEEVRRITQEISQNFGEVRVSDVARLLIEAGIEQYEAGKLSVQPKPTKFTLFDD